MRMLAVLLLTACAVNRPMGALVAAKDQPLKWTNGYHGIGPKGPFTCGLETQTGSQRLQQVCRYDDEDHDAQVRRQQLQQELTVPRGTTTPIL